MITFTRRAAASLFFSGYAADAKDGWARMLAFFPSHDVAAKPLRLTP
jgi:hypothetical protein